MKLPWKKSQNKLIIRYTYTCTYTPEDLQETLNQDPNEPVDECPCGKEDRHERQGYCEQCKLGVR